MGILALDNDICINVDKCVNIFYSNCDNRRATEKCTETTPIQKLFIMAVISPGNR